MKYIQNKKNALLILLLSLLPVIGILFLNSMVNNYYFSLMFERFTPLFFFTGGVYFVSAALFLFFTDNLTVKKWFFRSIWFTVAAAPFLLMFGFADGAFLSQLILFPTFFIYFLLFLFTPNYVYHSLKSKKTELSLGDKKYAFFILVFSISLLIAWFLLGNVSWSIKARDIMDQSSLFMFYTALVYFTSTISFLFFYDNSVVKKWIPFSLVFVFLTIPIYLSQSEALKSDSLDIAAVWQVFIVYTFLFISTPFYLHYQAKNFKKTDKNNKVCTTNNNQKTTTRSTKTSKN